MLSPQQLRDTLINVLDHAMPACAEVEYRLVGTSAALLQGVLLPAGDIDILVKEQAHVDAFGTTLASYKISELARDRPDRSTPLIQHMRVHGCDIELVRRGMEARGLPQAMQEHVLDQLKGASADSSA
jgi:hypothetical protein